MKTKKLIIPMGKEELQKKIATVVKQNVTKIGLKPISSRVYKEDMIEYILNANTSWDDPSMEWLTLK